jgi:hypothetical protein
MESKRFYYTPKDPANDPPVDPDFSADYEDGFIETENEEIGGSSSYRSLTPEARALLRARFKQWEKDTPPRDRIFGRKAE